MHTTTLTTFPYLQTQKLLNKLMLSLGYSEYVTQGGDWGHTVRFCALLTLVDETDSLTILLVDAGLGIPVWSSACQGLAYQLSSVGWFNLTFLFF